MVDHTSSNTARRPSRVSVETNAGSAGPTGAAKEPRAMTRLPWKTQKIAMKTAARSRRGLVVFNRRFSELLINLIPNSNYLLRPCRFAEVIAQENTHGYRHAVPHCREKM